MKLQPVHHNLQEYSVVGSQIRESVYHCCVTKQISILLCRGVAFAMLCSKIQIFDSQMGSLVLNHADERALGLHLLQFSEVDVFPLHFLTLVGMVFYLLIIRKFTYD